MNVLINTFEEIEDSKYENGMVMRYDLFPTLDKILQKKITYVHGPAGYGKTSLISSWVAKSNLSANVIWKDILDENCEQNHFLYDLIVSIEMFMSIDISDKSKYNDNTDLLFMRLNKLIKEVSNQRENTLIVLDNIQALEVKNVFERVLYKFRLFPDNIHFVILSRSLPIIGLSQLKLESSFLEIGVSQLKFSFAETEILLNEIYKLNLNKKSIHDINSLIDGWPSILKLTALSIQEKSYAIKNIKSIVLNNYYIYEYLNREIFQQYDDDIKNFMLKTCILNNLNYELCVHLTGEPCVTDILDKLYITHLIKESENTRDLTYLTLIKSYLNFKLLRDDFTASKTLTLQAANWYDENHMLDEAFNSYLKINDYAQCISILEKSASEAISNGEFAKFINLFEKLPLEELLKKPDLVIYYCTCFALTGKLDKDESILSLKGINLDSEIFKNYSQEIFSLRITSAIVRLDLDYGLELSKNYVESEPSIKLFKEITSANLGELYFFLGDLDKAETYYNTYNSYFKKNQNIYLYSLAQYRLGYMKYLEGNLHEASKLYRDNINVITHNDKPLTYATDIFYMGLSDIFYEINNLDNSYYYINKAIELTTLRKGYDELILEYILLAKIMIQKNELDKVLDVVDSIIKIVNEHNSEFVLSLLFYDVVLLLDKINRLDIADNFMLKYFQSEKNLQYFAYESQHFSKIFFLFKQRKFDSALKLLNNMECKIFNSKNVQSKIRHLLLSSMVKYEAGNKQEASMKLEKALILGYQHHYMRIFLDNIEYISDIIKYLKSTNITLDRELNDYIDEIISCKHIDNNLPACKEIETIDPLSKREMEVLKLIADGMSNIEISKQIFISESTVKKHINSIFNKLEVKNRAQAIKFYNNLSV